MNIILNELIFAKGSEHLLALSPTEVWTNVLIIYVEVKPCHST